MIQYKKGQVALIYLLIVLFLLCPTKIRAEFSLQTNLADSGTVTEHTTDRHVSVSLHKNNDKYVLREDVKVANGKNGYLDDYQVYKGKKYNGRVVSFTGKSLGYFPADEMNIVICRDGFGDASGCQEIIEGNIELRLPYFPNGKYAEIYNPKGDKILTIDLAMIAICNEDKICDMPEEDVENCPSDCEAQIVSPNKIESGISSDSKISSSGIGEQKEKTVASEGIGISLIVIVILLILTSLASIIFWLKKRKKDDYEEERKPDLDRN